MTAPASSQSHGLTPLFIWFPMRRYLFLVFLALCCAACTRRRSASETSLPADKKPFTIYLQPYEDFPQREADALRASITQALGRVYRGDWSHVEVLPSRPTPITSHASAISPVPCFATSPLPVPTLLL